MVKNLMSKEEEQEMIDEYKNHLEVKAALRAKLHNANQQLKEIKKEEDIWRNEKKIKEERISFLK